MRPICGKLLLAVTHLTTSPYLCITVDQEMTTAFTGYVEEATGKTILHLVIEEGKDDLLEMILPHGQSLISVTDGKENTALHIAVTKGMDVATERLLRRYDSHLTFTATRETLFFFVFLLLIYDWHSLSVMLDKKQTLNFRLKLVIFGP